MAIVPYGPLISLKTAIRQQQSLTYPGFDNFLAVDLALRELEYGNLQRASIMFDQMWRDDRFYSVLRKRLDAPETVPLLLQPADERAKARRIAESWGGVNDEPGRWDSSFPAAQLADLQKWGLGVGVGVAEIVWRTDDVLTDGEAQSVEVGTKYLNGERLRWTPTLRIWDSQWLRWDSWNERFILQTPDGEVVLPDVRDQPHGDGKWVVYCPFGYEQAYRKGLVRPLAKCVTRRSWVDRDWARYNEKNGLSLDKAIVPAEAPEEAKEQFFQAIAGRNSETAVMVEQSADPNRGKFDVELVEASAKTWDTFLASKGDVNTDIAVTVLGQNLTTEVGDAGSKAAEKGHAAVERSILRKDAASLAGAIYAQVLWHDAVHNYADGTLAPRPVYEVDPPEDQGTKAKMISDLGAGLVQMQTAKAPIDVRAVIEEAGIQTITEQEEAARAAVEAEEAAAQQADGLSMEGAPSRAGDAKTAGDNGKQLMRAPLPRGLVRKDFAGLSVVVEHSAGSMRPFQRPDGTSGATRMQNDYGYIDGHAGADDEELDCYLGPDPAAPDVHVVHQLKAPEFDKYDEDKTMLGFPSADEAKGAYLAHRGEDGAKAIGGMSVIPLDAFKRKLKARTGTGKIRASASHAETVVALQRLAERSGRAVETMRAGPKAPKKLAYADRLVRASITLGARALAPDLAAVKHEIEAAKDFSDLEKRLAKAFAGMDSEKFAGVVKRARVMAQLGGQLSAVKQT